MAIFATVNVPGELFSDGGIWGSVFEPASITPWPVLSDSVRETWQRSPMPMGERNHRGPSRGPPSAAARPLPGAHGFETSGCCWCPDSEHILSLPLSALPWLSRGCYTRECTCPHVQIHTRPLHKGYFSLNTSIIKKLGERSVKGDT